MGAPERPLADGHRLALDALRLGLARPPDIDVAEWADAYRYLPSAGASEYGRWHTDRMPFLREIMQTLSPNHPAQRVVYCKSTQVGGTECGLNWVGAFVGTQRGPMLCVQPTLDMAERWSKQRLAPMIDASPSLRDKIAPARARDSGNTVLLKEFPGGVLIIAGANSASGLRSMPAQYLFLDEVDAYPLELEAEGDPIKLAEARTATFGRRRKVFLCSTPTTATRSRIWREYQASDQRQYHVPCPHCGGLQPLMWEGLHWPDGEPEQAAYVCKHCGVLIVERHKTDMLAAGQWIAEHPERSVAGFWINGLYTPDGLGLSWVELAREWDSVKADPFASRTFENTRLGRTTSDPIQRIEWDEIKQRAGTDPVRTIPRGCLLLTAFADVQQDRLAVLIMGHGRGGVTWVIDFVEHPGDPNRPEVWDWLDRHLLEPIHNQRGVPMRITATGVDSGYLPDTVLAFTRPRQRRGVIATKGASIRGRPIIAGRPSKVDYTWRGRVIKHGAEVWITGVDTAKSMLFSRLEADRQALPGDNLVRFAAGLDDSFYSQLTAESYDTAHRKWVKIRPRNEALDCWAGALAAAYHPTVRVHTWRDAQWDRLEQALEPAADLFAQPAQADPTGTVPRDPVAPVTTPSTALAAVMQARAQRARPGGMGSDDWNSRL